MKHLILQLFLFAQITFALTAQQTTDIKSAEITFTFISKDVDGSISGFESSSSIDFDALSDSKFKGSVAVETIKTGNFLRDWSLKGSKYFDADTHPKITFESTQINKSSDGLIVKGTLTIKGTSKPITINFNREDNELVGTTTLFSSDYGIEIKNDRADNEVKVKLVLRM